MKEEKEKISNEIEKEIEELKGLKIDDVIVGSQIKEMSELLKPTIENNNKKLEESSKKVAMHGSEVVGHWKKEVIAGKIPDISVPIFGYLFKLIIKDKNDEILIPNYYVSQVEIKNDREMVVHFLFTEEFGEKLLELVNDRKKKFWMDIVFMSPSMDEVFEYKRDQLFKAKKIEMPILSRGRGSMPKSETINLKVTFKKPFFERFI